MWCCVMLMLCYWFILCHEYNRHRFLHACFIIMPNFAHQVSNHLHFLGFVSALGERWHLQVLLLASINIYCLLCDFDVSLMSLFCILNWLLGLCYVTLCILMYFVLYNKHLFLHACFIFGSMLNFARLQSFKSIFNSWASCLF